MRRIIAVLSLIFFTQSVLFAQEYLWKADFDYFFDNTEYSKSSFFDSETMQGIWLKPLAGITWDDHKHAVFGGVNLLKLPGTDEVLDKVDVTMYYQYKTPKVLFKAGAFPRNEVLGNYNNFFFKDSVNNYLPLMRGIFWQIGDERSFFNLWLDWTSYATATTREKFFFGFSGKATKGLAFADFQSYVYHNANTRPRTEGEGVHENIQLQSTLGLQYANENSFEGLVAAGVLMGYERDRFTDELHKPVGFVARADAEYWGIGTKNTLYIGDPRMRFFERYGGDLYWGTQFLRGKSYLESEWYVRLIESERVKARFNLNMHFSEGNLLFQQMFTVSATIGNFTNPVRKNTNYPWKRIFK